MDTSKDNAWNKSLCRSVSFLILRLLKKIEAHENNVVEGVTQPSQLCKINFYTQLFKTMSFFRRSPGDNSAAIIWDVSKSRRYGYQFAGTCWTCQCSTLNLTERRLPPSSTPEPTNPRSRASAANENQLEQLNSIFNTKRCCFHSRHPLKILLGRVMVFTKLHQQHIRKDENLNQPKLYKKEWLGKYYLTKDIHASEFFWSQKKFEDYAKNLHTNLRELLDVPDPRKIEPQKVYNQRIMEYHQDWDIEGGNIESIYDYRTGGGYRYPGEINKLGAMIGRGESRDAIYKTALDHCMFPKDFVLWHKDHFEEYKREALQDCAEDIEAAKRKHMANNKKRKRDQH